MTDKRTIGGDVRADDARITPQRSRKKVCAHCGEKLGFHAFIEFLKDGYSDDINCDICYKVNTLERGKANGVDAITIVVAFAAFVVFAALPTIAFAIHSMNGSGGFRVSAWAIAGGLILGFGASKFFLNLRRWQSAWITKPIDKTHMRERA